MATDQPLVVASTSLIPTHDAQRSSDLVPAGAQDRLYQLLHDTTDPIRELLGDVIATIAPGMRQVDWAEAHIDKARADHPAHTDTLYHAFRLLQPTAEVMRTEFVYDSHCRELLARIIAGDDTRAATNAEVAAACCEASLTAPLNLAGFTVYMRAWTAAFPDKLHVFGDAVDPYEYIAGPNADTLDGQLRRKLAVKDRTLRSVTCSGRHHGEPAPTCRFFTPEQLSLPVAAGDNR